VFIGFYIELAWQIFANLGGVFAACQEGKQEKADDEWRKSDRQGDIKSYEHSFLISLKLLYYIPIVWANIQYVNNFRECSAKKQNSG